MGSISIFSLDLGFLSFCLSLLCSYLYRYFSFEAVLFESHYFKGIGERKQEIFLLGKFPGAKSPKKEVDNSRGASSLLRELTYRNKDLGSPKVIDLTQKEVGLIMYSQVAPC